MEFIRATVYGFAKWHDFQIDFHPSELQIIYGENESGKSSLQQFILFMLFGLSPKKRAFFRSKTSGKMGGMLTIVEEGIGEYTIERVDEVNNGYAKCLLPNGEEADEAWLKRRLHGITRQTYQSIFSFDALDLTTLKTMNEEDIGDILLGVGLTGFTDIYAVEKRLDTKISELFKPFGKRPIINQQLDYLDDLTNKIQTVKSHEKTYSEKKTKLAEINAQIKELQRTIQVEKKNVSESEKMRQALPSLQKLSKYEHQLATFPKVITFPEDGIKRLESLKENILPLESELQVLKNNVTSYENKQAELKELLLKSNTYDEVKQLLETQDSYNEDVKEIKRLEGWIKEQEVGLKNELLAIDTNLKPVDLSDISLTYQTENTWVQLSEETQQLRIEKEKLAQEEAVQKKQKIELKNSLNKCNEYRLPAKQVDELSHRVHDYNNYHYRGNEGKQKTDFEAIKNKRHKNSLIIFSGSIIIGLLFGLFGFFQDYTWGYGVMLASFGFGIAQWIIGKRSTETIEQLITNNTGDSNNVMVTLEEKEEATQLLSSHDEAVRQVETIGEKLETNKIEQIKWQERHELMIQKANRVDEKVTHQRKLYPILETIDISNWPAFYHAFKSLLQQNLEWKSKKQQLADVKEVELNHREFIMRFLKDRNWESKYKSIDTGFAFLHEKVEEHDGTLRLLEQYEAWKKTANEQVESLKKKLQVFQREQLNLMKVAEVETEEQFYQKNTLLEDEKQVKLKIEEIKEQLSMTYSEDKIVEFAADSIGEITDIEEKQKKYQKNLELAEQKLEKEREQFAAIDADLAYMEGSDEHSQIMHRLHIETAELNKLGEKWAILKSAKEMLVETKNNYRDKYMERLINQTSDYFVMLTNHAYTNVYAPSKNQPFQVESANHLRYTVNELSQGTRDQLYIALRLAISEVMSKTHNMPFIIDDAFVHFDDIRVEYMMDLIASISKKRQVLLFTCKKGLIKDLTASNITVLHESIRKI
ncbi:ATP-binding protein [Virgibacillus necropolis]|uniref:YhaN AAA domain-containing protein n=1 Tax=Virgibacillus necropolis TaxID=163877 RepID=A0A221MG07_9BACI|nr:AAA family ATPase [Virgibacillus necropolis]ASN06597.1 hypothetical protein CFK40_17020 [Virgibacillus necropolis]